MGKCYINSGRCEGAQYSGNCNKCDIIVCRACMATKSTCPNCGNSYQWG